MISRDLILVIAALLTPVSAWASDDLGAQFLDTEIVVLGEVHDNPVHHANQAKIVERLRPAALVFEMITPGDARRITPGMRDTAAALDRHLNWSAGGWPDFALYYPIFAAAPEAAIFGGAVPRDQARQAVTDGAAALFGEAAPLFGLTQPLPEAEQTARIDLQRMAHCDAMPENMLPGMVEAQRLRDAALARATIAAFETARAVSDTPQVVVITGNGHAREDWGMTAMLRSYYADQPDIDIAALAQFETEPDPSQRFTAQIVTPATDRPDPCDAFK